MFHELGLFCSYISLAIETALVGQSQVVVAYKSSQILVAEEVLFDNLPVQTILNPFFIGAEIKIYNNHNPK
jgi:hypothetical protein